MGPLEIIEPGTILATMFKVHRVYAAIMVVIRLKGCSAASKCMHKYRSAT